MKTVQLFMIGNSHIDPCWFWGKDEGMQEVKATFLSALERMKEYPDFIFTATSAVFFEFIGQNCPALLEEIKQRAAEGRFEIAGGWYVEADACLPHGESLVRQGLYAQQYFKKTFGQICRTAFLPDTFGHAESIPMLLSGVGLSYHVHQRPDRKALSPALYAEHPEYSDPYPLSRWQYRDGSAVTKYHLPSEYTVWFDEKLIEAVELCLDAAGDGDTLACCYGVGNHGGGPTVANIEAILRNRHYTNAAGDRAELRFSRLDAFMDMADENHLAIFEGSLDSRTTGCYSTDMQLKKAMRAAEHALLTAEKICYMARKTVQAPVGTAAEFKPLWKKTLFNQFHDMICGTTAKSARDNACAELGGVLSSAGELQARGLQAVANAVDTSSLAETGAFPLFIFNPVLAPHNGMLEVEIPWFCKAHLRICNNKGEEIPYQRVKTESTMINYNLGGRRRVVLPVSLPSFGYAVYLLDSTEPDGRTDTGPFWIAGGLPENTEPHTVGGDVGLLTGQDAYIFGNGLINVSIDGKTGLPIRLEECSGGAVKAQPLTGAMKLEIFEDSGDSWGGKNYQTATGVFLQADELRMLEDGWARKVMKATLHAEGAYAEILYTLYDGDPGLHMSVRLFYNRPGAALMLVCPLSDMSGILAEIPYGVSHRSTDGKPFYMQGFLSLPSLTVFNNGCYSYTPHEDVLHIPLTRCTIYSHGAAKNWYSEHADYDYADRGRLEHEFLLLPHRERPEKAALCAAAEGFQQKKPYLLDTWHDGSLSACDRSILSADSADLLLTAAKAGEDNGDVLRFFNPGDAPVITDIRQNGNPLFTALLAPGGLQTIKHSAETLLVCNLLEEASL